MQQDNSQFEELYRKITVTSRCRFHASHRLKYHHLFSQWTSALISVVLIVLPLIGAFKLYPEIDYKLFSVLQIAFAILILVYTLLLGALSFELRSEKLHGCGVELHLLAYKVLNCKNNDKFRYLYGEYNGILDKYENHKNNDYLIVRLNMREHYYKSRPRLILNYLLSRMYIVIEYVVYLVIPAIILLGVNETIIK